MNHQQLCTKNAGFTSAVLLSAPKESRRCYVLLICSGLGLGRPSVLDGTGSRSLYVQSRDLMYYYYCCIYIPGVRESTIHVLLIGCVRVIALGVSFLIFSFTCPSDMGGECSFCVGDRIMRCMHIDNRKEK